MVSRIFEAVGIGTGNHVEGGSLKGFQNPGIIIDSFNDMLREGYGQFDPDILPGMDRSGIKKGRLLVSSRDISTDRDQNDIPFFPGFTDSFNPHLLWVVLCQ